MPSRSKYFCRASAGGSSSSSSREEEPPPPVESPGLKSRVEQARQGRASLLRGIIIGQAPSKHAAGAAPPLGGAAEKRLSRLSGLAVAELWTTFDRHNLLQYFPGCKPRAAKHCASTGYDRHQSNGDVFPLEEAKQAARALDLNGYSLAVLLGLNVARAFGVAAPAMFKKELRGRCTLLVFPHPSGVSHFWNTPSNLDRAATELREAMSKSCLAAAPLVSRRRQQQEIQADHRPQQTRRRQRRVEKPQDEGGSGGTPPPKKAKAA